MDINDFGLDSDYFGYGGGNYRQMPKSNTSFMNFTIEDTEEYKRALRRYNSTMEDLVTDAEKAAETERFQNEVRALRINLGGSRVVTGLQTFNDILKKLGVQPPRTTNANTQITSSSPTPQPRRFPWALVITSVVVLGGAAFAIYKLRK